MDTITTKYFPCGFLIFQKFKENLFYLLNSKFTIEFFTRKYIGNSNKFPSNNGTISFKVLHLSNALSVQCAHSYLPRQSCSYMLHLCDALFVHCANTSPREASQIEVASVPCTVRSLCRATSANSNSEFALHLFDAL